VTLLGRRCAECGGSIDHLAVDAVHCKPACKQRAYRKRKGLSGSAQTLSRTERLALRQRHAAAVRLLDCGDLDALERFDLLVEVVWPDDARLQMVASREAA
jgi:hypothetical protein